MKPWGPSRSDGRVLQIFLTFVVAPKLQQSYARYPQNLSSDKQLSLYE